MTFISFYRHCNRGIMVKIMGLMLIIICRFLNCRVLPCDFNVFMNSVQKIIKTKFINNVSVEARGGLI